MSPNAINQLFIFHMSQMTSGLNVEWPNSYPWVIRSVSLLPEGPMALFDCQWPDKKHVSTMSLRARMGKFSLTPETCHLGEYGTKALEALHKRFELSNVELLKLVGR